MILILPLLQLLPLALASIPRRVRFQSQLARAERNGLTTNGARHICDATRVQCSAQSTSLIRLHVRSQKNLTRSQTDWNNSAQMVNEIRPGVQMTANSNLDSKTTSFLSQPEDVCGCGNKQHKTRSSVAYSHILEYSI